jgi:DNA invertase Pin-like site-specific DNA recombinase
VQASSRKGRDQRRIDELLGALAAGDRVVVSERSRLGRSLGQVIQLVDELVKRKVRFTAIKEGIRFEGKQDLQTKVMIALFGLFAEVERDLISERTKEGLAAVRAQGRLLGRPKGSLGTSKLDGQEGEIRMLLEKEVSKASIAKILGVSPTNLRHFIRTRNLTPETSKGGSKSGGRQRRS